MKAMVLDKIMAVEHQPLTLKELPIPHPRDDEVLVKVLACGICHTELDEIEGRLIPQLPIILGHEIVGRVERLGAQSTRFQLDDRVGITWLNKACGHCHFCITGHENLCETAQWTGKDVDGGYSEYTTVSEEFAYPIPDVFSNTEAAPLLCAGVIGFRALRLTQMTNPETLGLYGFGASAHIVIQIVKYQYPDSRVFVFTRSQAHRDLAKELGADWTGSADDTPPAPLHCAIDFTPVGSTVREALRVLDKGGRLIINAIRKRDPIPELDYTRHLWHEKAIKSVANVTRRDAIDFLPIAAKIPIKPHTQVFKLEEANTALLQLKHGKIQGAGVLIP